MILIYIKKIDKRIIYLSNKVKYNSEKEQNLQIF